MDALGIVENVLGPCRLPYELITTSALPSSTPASSFEKKKLDKGYLLSTKDLCGLPFLPQLIKAGVMCFKIEGRMKTPEYVATVTRIYRKYIDLVLADKPYQIDKKDIEDLAQVFNRGHFSSGHLEAQANQSLVFPDKPNHMGIYVGNIANLKSNKGHVFVNLTDSLSLGDTIQFEKENTKYTISELMLKGKNVPTAFSKQLAEIGRMKGNLHIGDKIYRLSSKELTTFAKSSYQEECKKVFLHGHIVLKKHEPIVFCVSTEPTSNRLFEDISVSCSSEDVPIEAKAKPLDKERVVSQLSKTKDTIFTFAHIDVTLEDNLFLPSIKVLNELRRTALEEIYWTAQSRLLRKSPTLCEIKQIEKEKKENHKKSISILLNHLDEHEDYEKLKNVDQVYLPLQYFCNKQYEKVIHTITQHFDTYLYLPPITKGNYKNLLTNVINQSIALFPIKGFVVSNLGNAIFMEKIKEIYGDRFTFIGNYTFNMFNLQTQQELKNLGMKKLTISPELDAQTIRHITMSSTIEQELIVYGRIPLMFINYCLLGKTNKCYPTCNAYCKEKKNYYLKDRLGFTFRVIPDNMQTVSTIYNSKITSIDASSFPISSYRIDLLEETVEQINSIIETILAGKRLEGKEYTNGNLNREL